MAEKRISLRSNDTAPEQIVTRRFSRSSRSSTASTFDQKTEVIVYDYKNRKLSKEPKSKVIGLSLSGGNLPVGRADSKSDEMSTEVDIPGFSTRCDVLLPIKSSGAKFYLATIDLARLGRSVKSKRQRGAIRTIFVVSKVEES